VSDGTIVCQFCCIVAEGNIIDQTYEKRTIMGESGSDPNSSRVQCKVNPLLPSQGLQTSTKGSGKSEISTILNKKNYPMDDASERVIAQGLRRIQ
jgi:transcription initiation factor TFIIIB Brf1 subunit/transcription initiation factor TFIIB